MVEAKPREVVEQEECADTIWKHLIFQQRKRLLTDERGRPVLLQ